MLHNEVGLFISNMCHACFPHCRCKKMGVPVDKIYNKSQRDKFAWAIDMTEVDFEF